LNTVLHFAWFICDGETMKMAPSIVKEQRIACSTGCSTAAPRRALRAPSQPTCGSGSLALSLNGSSRVSDRQPKACVMCGEPMVSVSSLYGGSP
jgi:hypothetical protein